jgi:Pregnancy-associated plasma protein-A
MGLIRRTFMIVTTIAVSIPMFAAPVAAASRSLPSWACAPGASAAHDATASVPVPAGRGGQLREPDSTQAHSDMPKTAKGRAPADFAITVDVYFHVVTDGALGNLTSRQINAQIAVLNKTFGGREGGAATGFSFQLAGVTRTDNAKWFAVKTGAEHDMKQSLKQGDDSDLNVYSTTAAAYLGWAYLPSITDTNQSYLDGIVLDWETLPGVSDAYAGAYDLGETLTHEAGHWLNLEHTFQGGCKDPGDFVDDTPAQATPTSGCPEGKDTCAAPGLDPIHNYMDYSFDSCYTEFTPGQTQRMRDAWLLYRAS